MSVDRLRDPPVGRTADVPLVARMRLDLFAGTERAALGRWNLLDRDKTSLRPRSDETSREGQLAFERLRSMMPLADLQPFGGHQIDWGNAATWVGSVLSSVSVILALSIIIRDRRLLVRQQADQILAVLTYVNAHGIAPTFQLDLTVRNTSKLPIIGPRFVIQDTRPRRAIRSLRDVSLTDERRKALEDQLRDASFTEGMQVLYLTQLDAMNDLDGAGTATARTDLDLPYACYDFYLLFIDAASRQWCRDMTNRRMWIVRSSIRMRILAKLFRRYRWHDRAPAA